MDSAININNLTVSYSGADAINNISLDIKKGEFVCIMGPNGGGKTTLLNTVLGFLKPDSGHIEISRSSSVSYVPQIAAIDRDFPITALETVMTAFLKSGLHPFKKFSKAERQKATDILKEVGLEQYAQRQISGLSGGEFQRLLIARALASDPKILLLDEPTASVDITSRDKIFSILKELNCKGITVITVTHDIPAACSYATRFVLINRELIYSGEPLATKKINQIMYEGNFSQIREERPDA